jgi:anti-sigma28 factor (negative regulator of flagellin synthesis)
LPETVLEALLQLLIKESKMTVLSQQNTQATATAENTDISLNWGASNNARGRITAPALQKKHLLPLVRQKKILEIRQQITEGTYDLDKRLNIALDYLLDDIIRIGQHNRLFVSKCWPVNNRFASLTRHRLISVRDN